jgi:hypothetical protein
MKDYEEKIIALLREKGDYSFGLLGYISDQYTAGELMQIPAVYSAVINSHGSLFVEDVIQEAIEDEGYPFREELLQLVPEDVQLGDPS